MKNFEHYLIIMFSAMLFVFRIVVVITTVLAVEFSVKSLNVNFEIALLLLTLISIILMSKTKLSGAIIFLVSSIAYYGPDLYNAFINISEVTSTQNGIIQVVTSLIGVLIPLFAFFIIAFAKEQEKRPVDKKTDFYYKDDTYDRKYDERADKNNYRIY